MGRVRSFDDDGSVLKCGLERFIKCLEDGLLFRGYSIESAIIHDFLISTTFLLEL